MWNGTCLNRKSDCNCAIVPSKAFTHSVIIGWDMYYFTLCKLSNFNLPALINSSRTSMSVTIQCIARQIRSACSQHIPTAPVLEQSQQGPLCTIDIRLYTDYIIRSSLCVKLLFSKQLCIFNIYQNIKKAFII